MPAAASRAYELTKQRIIDGDIAGGALLSEGQVADELGISRTPVREAFLRLEAEQLLTLIPKRGAVVVPVGPTEALDVLETRIALEEAAARRLVLRDGLLAAARSTLDDVLTQQQALADAGDVRAFAEADARFHQGIVTASGNTVAAGFYASLADRQRRMAVHAVGPRVEHLQTLLQEHRDLLDVLQRRDVEAFLVALTAHLEATHGVALGGRS